MLDATQLLKKDHKEVKALFKEFERMRDRVLQKKQPVVSQICHALTVHAQLEEELVYPVLKELRSHDIKDLVAEAAEEHQVATTLIEELTVLSSDDAQYDAKVTVLKEYVQHHVKEEEQELFHKARKHFSAKRLGGARRSHHRAAPSNRQRSGRRAARPSRISDAMGCVPVLVCSL